MVPLGTFQNIQIKNNVPSPAVAIPAGRNFMNVLLSRENWPAAGADLELLASFDGGVTYETVAGPQHIDVFIPSVKQPNPTPAKIGFSWSPARIPTHAKGRAATPQTFTATLSIEAG